MRLEDYDKKVLSVQNLTKRFGTGCSHCTSHEAILEHNYCPHCRTVYACRNMSFDLYKGEILGVVGESGSGKSTCVRCLYFDQDVTEGAAYIYHDNVSSENIWSVSSQKKHHIRDRYFGMVYQNPYLGLKMKFSAIANVGEKMIAAGHRRVKTISHRAHHLLDVVKIETYRRQEAPENYSGGMQQRVQIAKALSNEPPILFLDEITTGLDLSVQANVLDLIQSIQRDLNISMILVSHDLGVIRMLADRTLVMLDGQIIEQGLTDQILEDPRHPYTQQLVQSLL